MMQSPLSTEHGIRQSKTSPSFLHSNSTSHTWPFSAIAELIDNAYDPDVAARQLFIDMEDVNGTQCLTFTDNGAGMTPEKLHKMLSFGFCEKVEINGHKPVGHYGNGFKSGSMRLGKDAIVFTKNGKFMSVGFLSQTYLASLGAETVITPIVGFDTAEILVHTEDGKPSLQHITKYSIFKSKQELMEQFGKVPGRKGTRIVIYNIRRTKDGRPEFDFIDETDFKIPDDIIDEQAGKKFRRQDRQDYSPECDYSLRAYCSILYLNPKMQIILRGKKVKTQKIAKSLNNTERDVYKPQWLPRGVKITFGFSPQKNHYGIMMYHRNRLIKAYERVGPQLKPGRQGVGVIGVIQCDFLQPTHNKQDFDYTKEYRSTLSALGLKLTDYWLQKKGHTSLARSNSPAIAPGPEEEEPAPSPDQLWVQCDNADCLKWRKLPEQWKNKKLPDKWYCNMNPDPNFRSCSVPEEPEDDPDEEIAGPSYDKSVKRQLEREKREEKYRREQKQQMAIQEKEKQLRQKDLQLQRLGAQIQQSIQSQAGDKKPSHADLVRAEIEMNRRKQMETQYQKMVVELKKQESQLHKQREELLQAQQVAHHWKQRAEASVSTATTSQRTPRQPQAGPSGFAPQKRQSNSPTIPPSSKVPRMDDSDDDCIIVEDNPKTSFTSAAKVKVETCHTGVQTDPADVVRVSASTVREVAALSAKLSATDQRQLLMEQTKRLNEQTAQLKSLRRNVSRLIGVLVPELSLEDNDIDMESESVDELLKQVLEANKNQ